MNRLFYDYGGLGVGGNTPSPARIKAEELVEKFTPFTSWIMEAIDCSIIAVEEIQKAVHIDWMEDEPFWNEVLTELKNMK